MSMPPRTIFTDYVFVYLYVSFCLAETKYDSFWLLHPLTLPLPFHILLQLCPSFCQFISTNMPTITVLDYGAGNIRSLLNALKLLGYDVSFVKEPGDIQKAEKLIFPGVGAFGSAMVSLKEAGYIEPLKEYILQNKPFLGICLGLQTLCSGSEESPGMEGLGIIPTNVRLLKAPGRAVPHMGWNGLNIKKPSASIPSDLSQEGKVYFVHSYAVPFDHNVKDWVLATTNYGSEFVSIVQQGNVMATQFHPEKSGKLGLKLIKHFLNNSSTTGSTGNVSVVSPVGRKTKLAPRIIACLDVRANDEGDLVVTKGEQYDVRERQSPVNSSTSGTKQKGAVRNLGKPVELARRYYAEGADEIVFLNITSFRNCPLQDLPMLQVLRQASENIFVPLTVGGGIRDLQVPEQSKDDTTNEADAPRMRTYSALEVASAYFRSGKHTVQGMKFTPLGN